MTTSNPDIQPAVQHSAQVAIAGAGPVGLTIANYLGQMGVSVVLIEKLESLIDYPRAIGIDDEALRAMQAVGLVDNVLPHTTPWHAMRFLTPKGRCFADIQPMTDEFGWSRRNAFIQPQVDAVLYDGLSRFPHVRCLFSREVEAFSQNSDGVTLNVKGSDGERETVRADWLVACDGGASFIRRARRINGLLLISPTIRWRRRTSTCAATRCARMSPPRCRTGYGVSNLWSCPVKPKPSSASRIRCASY